MAHAPGDAGERWTAALRRRSGLASACLVVATALMLQACGEDLANPPIDKTGLAAIDHLSRRQYRAIDNALASGLRFSALSGTGRLNTGESYNSAVTRTLRACGKLDGNDPLLRELFRSCAGESRVLVPLIEGRKCASAATCARAFRLARHRLAYLAKRYARHNRAVAETSLPAACRRALSLSRADYAYIRRQRPIFKRIEVAIERRDSIRLANALAAQGELDKRSLADARRTLRRVRKHCR